MKNSFNMSTLHHGATCSLCQDTLLRHISQSRVFWYCPSCRQETVCEGPIGEPEPAPHIPAIVPQRTVPKVIDLSQHLTVNAS